MITAEEIQKKAERKFPDFLKWKARQILLNDSYHSELLTEQSRSSVSESEKLNDNDYFFPLEIKADKGKANGNLIEYEKQIAPLIEKSKQKVGNGYELLFEDNLAF